MRYDIESVLKNVTKAAVPNSTFEKVDDALRNLENRKGEKYMKPKYKKPIVAAAALTATLLISGAAFAAALWNGQQAKLRAILNVEGKDIPEYVEYNPAGTEPFAEINFSETNSETAAKGLNVAVLSSMKDAQFMNYYISVSPVTLEQAENSNWYVSREGSDKWILACPISALDSAYDESGQSLLLRFSLMTGAFIDSGETEPFKVILCREDRRISASAIARLEAENGNSETSPPMTFTRLCKLAPDAFESAEFTVIPNADDIAAVSIDFGDGIEFKNPQTGETGLILGARVNSGSFAWIYAYPGIEKHYADGGLSLYASESIAWVNAFEDAIRNAVILMSDGSTVKAPIPNASDFEGGALAGYGRFDFPIELSAVKDVIVRAD